MEGARVKFNVFFKKKTGKIYKKYHFWASND